MKVSIISLTIALTSALVAANPQTPSHPDAPARVRREPQIQSESGPATTTPTGLPEFPGCTETCKKRWLMYRH
ncbi:hypothetical protein LY76DRAFT_642338 [Colletotrichum caudatum]|nr:hypothetical protein LY76DRAFT_642338 [Colletotrichum caudatum]